MKEKKKRFTKMDLVELYLTAYPETRQHKLNLITKIWADECEALEITTISEFFTALKGKKCSNPETLRRNDMIIKNEKPELKPTDDVIAENVKAEARVRQMIQDRKNKK